MTPETKLKNEVTKYLDSIGAYHLPYFPTIYSPSGIPDRYVCLNGYHFWIEFKSEKGKLSKIQEYQLEKMAQHDILVIILYPSDLDKFKIFCETLKGDEPCDKAIFPSIRNVPIPTT